VGSLITLGIDRLEVDWGKNNIGRHYGALFQPSDHADAAYYYADNVIEQYPAYVRPLSRVLPRLRLLGYSDGYCRMHLEDMLAEVRETNESIVDKLIDTLARVRPVKMRLDDSDPDYYDLGEYASSFVFADPEFRQYMTVSSGVGEMLENIDPLVTLTLLARNPRNLRRNIIWRYHDVVADGSVTADELYPRLNASQKFLIVTEGSTDSFVIRRAFDLLRPDIADFFSFIDMREHYPFTGTGNLVNFVKGLAKIQVQNKIVCVFDNDAEGHLQLSRLGNVALPPNLLVTSLPDVTRKFQTLGTAGAKRENINGRAVGIECFLDLAGDEPAIVRWSNYIAEIDRYQGAIVGKERFLTRFKEVKSVRTKYDFSALGNLVDFVTERCCAMSSGLSMLTSTPI
jgi:hypothetical protein